MKISTAWSILPDTTSAADAIGEQLAASLGQPSIVFLHATAGHDPAACIAAIQGRFPQAKLHGASTCLGVMTEQGFHSAGGVGMGALGICDPDGLYGVGAASIRADAGGDARQAAVLALNAALDDAALMGMPPAMLWICAPPGAEEDVLAGIQSVVGDQIPIAGGSSADNEVAGKWWQLCGPRAAADAVVIAALLPSTAAATSFHSGYTPTAHRGTITAATDRVVHAIDGQPAAKVYDAWTQGQLSDVLGAPHNILARSTFHPLGTPVGSVGGVAAAFYQLAHPAAVLEDGSIALFARVEVGQQLVLMTGTPDSLATRAGRVAKSAMDAASLSQDQTAGALVIYCAGCMLGIQDRMDEVAASLRDALGPHPFLGCFTFGEQGCFVGGVNRHGNLMISVLAFGGDQ